MLAWATNMFEWLLGKRSPPPPPPLRRAPEVYHSEFWEGRQPPPRYGDIVEIDPEGWRRHYYPPKEK